MFSIFGESEMVDLRRGRNLHQEGHCEAAEVIYKGLLENFPDHPLVLQLYGLLLCDTARSNLSIPLFLKCIEKNPKDALSHNNIAWAYLQMQQPIFALPHARQALCVRQNYEKAALCVAKSSLAIFRLYGGRVEVAHTPDGLFDESLLDLCYSALDRVLVLNPHNVKAISDLAVLKMYCCDWSGWECGWGVIRREINGGNVAISCFDLMAVLDEPELHRECARLIFGKLGSPSRFSHHKRESGRVKVAYLSADFHDHATSRLMAGVFENHNKDRFEIFAISIGDDAKGDPMRGRLLNAFEHFVDLKNVDSKGVANWIFNQQIDILVDLKGYTGQAKYDVLSYKPAPLIVNYLGYPGTMGCDVVDYIFGDSWVTPFSHCVYFSEKIVQLPGSYQCNDDRRKFSAFAPSRETLGLPDDGFVFAAFNASYKITPPIFDVWMRLLRRLPNAVIWMISDDPLIRNNLRNEAEARGVSGERLIFAPKVAPEEHLARHSAADIFLDTFPYNAHTTASDALWCGLPVITCIGKSFASRVGASLLDACNLPHLISDNLSDYEEKAYYYATHPDELFQLKSGMSERVLKTPLFDTAGFTRNIEMAFMIMFGRWSAGLESCEFSVDDVARSAE